MRRKLFESRIQVFLVLATVGMIILRILLNEKGRTTPDSIRFMRTSNVFPSIDNTTTPLGYPLSIKFGTLFGLDEFWASKVVGILCYLFIVYFAAKKKFYIRETILVGGLFSFVSIYSATLSEALMLPFVFVFLYVARQIIIGETTKKQGFIYLTLSLIAVYNVRYSALFIMGGVFLFGLLNFRKHYSRIFIYSALAGLSFVVLYKFLFIDYFNDKYIDAFLDIAVHPTSKLLPELFSGLATAFNPFIHIANPAGGIINAGIYAVGFLNILVIAFLFVRNKLSETQYFLVFIAVCGILCSYFTQYFYVIDPLDYRLLTPFSFPIWLVYFRKLYAVFGRYTYAVTVLSLITGLTFILLAKGNYLVNRKAITEFLKEENLTEGRIQFYVDDPKNLSKGQIAELISTVNPNITFTSKPADTIKNTTVTPYRVSKKINIDTNKFQ